MTLIEFHEFLKLYAWELLVTVISTASVCTLFVIWIEIRNERITKNWKEYVNAPQTR